MQPWVSMPGAGYLQVRDGMMAAVERAVFQGADVDTTLRAKQDELAALIRTDRK
ncbi:hypothetical protein [Actinomadura rugatobispora]|uniref:Uncharacterized protein n=1 Tax=Actinomadura rugatobispora TaxID=1994 RepID=A0ABW1ACB4_9ACTN|nr:hypothetical protein GCM10010200_097750 [Actinomadura rugatobispora]